MKREFQYLLAAIQFFTRLPLPLAPPHDRVSLNHALKYFPLVGWLVGAGCALVFSLAVAIWPAAIAVIVSLAFGVLLTGALHEDGFADSCDGFGGGWNREQVLAIMKDPRIGSYAAIGLILLFMLKATALVALAWESTELVVVALLLGHSFSRWLVLPLPWWLDYVRESGDSKSRDMVETRFDGTMFAWAGLFTVLPGMDFRRAAVFTGRSFSPH